MKDAQGEGGRFESRFGRSFWATLALVAAALAYVAWAMIQIRRGNSTVAILFVASVFICAPIFALFVINLPKFIKEAKAARARPLEGVVYDGREVAIMERFGTAYANASQAASAMGLDPKRWPLRFAQMGEGALISVDGEFWARRDAWVWRSAREKDLSLGRMAKKLQREGFGAIDRREEAAARARIEQGILALEDPEKIRELSTELNRREFAAKQQAQAIQSEQGRQNGD